MSGVSNRGCTCARHHWDPLCPVHGRKRCVPNLLAIAAFYIAVVIAVFTAPADAHARPTPLVICDVFGRYCSEALEVSYCESGWSTSARNGQYRGIFQLGSWERRRFGHGPDAFTQAKAAWRYFRASGRDWSPWSCSPR